jgi:hypothetical protein
VKSNHGPWGKGFLSGSVFLAQAFDLKVVGDSILASGLVIITAIFFVAADGRGSRQLLERSAGDGRYL